MVIIWLIRFVIFNLHYIGQIKFEISLVPFKQLQNDSFLSYFGQSVPHNKSSPKYATLGSNIAPYPLNIRSGSALQIRPGVFLQYPNTGTDPFYVFALKQSFEQRTSLDLEVQVLFLTSGPKVARIWFEVRTRPPQPHPAHLFTKPNKI